ncbi:unnamed protein product [Eruca vesicaria subsp. sativa]|uniref:PGG domain-containing protein n=1 Tax=Eruca vesicaria subsp. sativa TaxID=29727 RepID=A0ABC8JC66_ERUVS|nr:unnamed protein product [Eruca vesicaria subsp. sativa]
MELMTLIKPSLALKLNVSGFSPMHLALQKKHIQIVRGFLAIDSSLVSIKGRGRITPLHYVAQLGNEELLSEFLFACPSSVEDVTIKCETAVHIALRSRQFMAFKVLLGWLRRVNREEILDWKDEDGNTVFHIAASMNQIEVMKLLRRTVNVEAKNLDGLTAMDLLQTQTSSIFTRAARLLRSALRGPTMTLAGYLSRKPSAIERGNKLLGVNNLGKTRQGSQESSDFRNAILVVAVLIVTATYQAGLIPPGGYWQENSTDSDNDSHTAGQMTICLLDLLQCFIYICNGIAFFLMILITGLPMWKVIYGSTAALGMANYASFRSTFPSSDGALGDIAVALVWYAYPVITGTLLLWCSIEFFTNKRRRQRVDFPARYFSSVQEL